MNCEEILVEVGKAVPLGLISNELISNSLKHAFQADTTGTIEIELRKANHNLVCLEIRDDGVGLSHPIEFETAQSLGLKLTNLLVKQLNGKIQLVPKPSGTAFRIEFRL